VTSPDIVSEHSLATVYQRVGTSSHGGKVTGKHGSSIVQTNVVQKGISTQLSTSTTTTVSSDAEIDVVFANSGSYPEVRIPVKLYVTVGGESVLTVKKTVPQVAIGEQTTVSFTNLHLPTSAFGANAAIYVKIGGVPLETDLGDNTATYPVLFELAPS